MKQLIGINFFTKKLKTGEGTTLDQLALLARERRPEETQIYTGTKTQNNTDLFPYLSGEVRKFVWSS